MNRKTHRLWIILGLALILGGCVSQTAHRDVIKNLDQTKIDTARLIEQNQILSLELSNRSGEINSLRIINEDLQTHYKNQSSDLELVTQRNLELTGEVARLTRHNRNMMDRLESQTFDIEPKLHDLESITQTQAEELEILRTQLLEIGKEREESKKILTAIHDRLAETLKGKIQKNEAQVVLQLDRLWIRLSENLLFESGHFDQIHPEGGKLIDQIGIIFKDNPIKRIEIHGHTDNIPISSKITGRFPTNWELSTARASTVVRYFIEPVGIIPSLLQAAGFADSRPINDNDTPENRAVNRRVEIVVIPMVGTHSTEIQSEENESKTSQIHP